MLLLSCFLNPVITCLSFAVSPPPPPPHPPAPKKRKTCFNLSAKDNQILLAWISTVAFLKCLMKISVKIGHIIIITSFREKLKHKLSPY